MNGCESPYAHEGCLQIRLGKDAGADNYYHCDCCIKEETFTISMPQPHALNRAVLQQARWDDRMQLWINKHKIWQSNADFPPETGGSCELDSNFDLGKPVILNNDRFQSASNQITF